MMAPWLVLGLLTMVLVYFTWPEGTMKTAAGVGGGVWVIAGTAVFLGVVW